MLPRLFLYYCPTKRHRNTEIIDAGMLLAITKPNHSFEKFCFQFYLNMDDIIQIVDTSLQTNCPKSDKSTDI